MQNGYAILPVSVRPLDTASKVDFRMPIGNRAQFRSGSARRSPLVSRSWSALQVKRTHRRPIRLRGGLQFHQPTADLWWQAFVRMLGKGPLQPPQRCRASWTITASRSDYGTIRATVSSGHVLRWPLAYRRTLLVLMVGHVVGAAPLTSWRRHIRLRALRRTPRSATRSTCS